MAAPAHRAHDPILVSIDRVSRYGVTVEPWLDPGQSPPDRRRDGPVLYLVGDDHAPPVLGHPLDDWVRLPVTCAELEARALALLRRALNLGALPVLLDDLLLCVGHRRTILSDLDARLLGALLDRRGELVDRATCITAMWPEQPPSDVRALDNRVRHLRTRLGGLPLDVQTVRGRGFVLEWDPAAADPTWFRELETW